MEGKKSAKSFVDELFPRRDATAAKTDILSEIFPPKSAGSSRKQGSEGHNSNARSTAPDGSQGSSSKNQSIHKKHNGPVLLCEIAEPCLMSSSVHYGSRDDFMSESSHKNSSGTSYTSQKDQKDGSDISNIDTRGEWWQGSYYY